MAGADREDREPERPPADGDAQDGGGEDHRRSATGADERDAGGAEGGHTADSVKFPAHEAIDAHTRDSVAKTKAAQTNRRIATAQTALTKPMDAAELRRQAEVEEANAKAVRKRMRRQRKLARRWQKRFDALARSRRPGRFDLSELVLVTLGAAGCDVPVLFISMTDVPGAWYWHLVVAVLGSLGLAVFGTLVGWAWAHLWEALSDQKHRVRVGWAALVALLGVFLGTVVALAVFRSEEMVRLTDNDFHIADPYFFGPLQVLLVAVAAVAAFRYFLAGEGRETLARLRAELAKLVALTDLWQRLVANAESLRRAASQAGIDGAKAIISYVHYSMLEEAEVQSVNAQGNFVHGWFNTMFLRDRFQPLPVVEDDGFVRFISGYDERAHRLLSFVAGALMGLAVLALGASALALLRHYPGVAAGALVAALVFGALGVYVAYIAGKPRSDQALVTAFLSAASSERSAVAAGAEDNGAGTPEQAEQAVAAAAGIGNEE